MSACAWVRRSVILFKGRPKVTIVFGTEDKRFMKPSVPKITDDDRRPKVMVRGVKENERERESKSKRARGEERTTNERISFCLLEHRHLTGILIPN